jgi:CHAD domain-containing protein
MTAATTLSRQYAQLMLQLNRQVIACCGMPEIDLVHRMRLNIKKIRVFNLLIELQDTKSETLPENNYLNPSTLFKISGKLRDTQVQLKLLKENEHKLSKKYHGFSKWLGQREASYKQRLLHSEVVRFLDVPPAHSLEKINTAESDFNSDMLRKAFSKLYNNCIQIADNERNNRSLHECRTYLKQLRYLTQFAAKHTGQQDVASGIIATLRKAETIAGQWHDYVVAVGLLEKYIAGLHANNKRQKIRYESLLNVYKQVSDELFLHSWEAIVKALSRCFGQDGIPRKLYV